MPRRPRACPTPGQGTRTPRRERLTAHLELGEGHPLQLHAQQLARRVLQELEKRRGLAVMELSQHPVLLPEMLVADLRPQTGETRVRGWGFTTTVRQVSTWLAECFRGVGCFCVRPTVSAFTSRSLTHFQLTRCVM